MTFHKHGIVADRRTVTWANLVAIVGAVASLPAAVGTARYSAVNAAETVQAVQSEQIRQLQDADKSQATDIKEILKGVSRIEGILGGHP